MKIEYLKKIKLPQNPGVYFFKDQKGKILYIGRATSLRDRVKSYFAHDLFVTRGPLIVDMVTRAKKVDFEKADSVLEAIILESNLIKKHQPYFNTKEKDDRSYNYVVITDEEFPRVLVERGRNLENGAMDEDGNYDYGKKAKIFGPYTQGAHLNEALRIIRKIFPFRDSHSNIAFHESFYKSLGLSPETGTEEAKREYMKSIRNIVLFLQGKKKELLKILKREMKGYAKAKEFEKAKVVRDTLYALIHIQDVALIKRETSTVDGTRQVPRIEAYDIAHMSGKNTVGVMVVSNGEEFAKSEYRKFKIKIDVNNDVAGLREVLTRRFGHSEWPKPNIIVIDGSLAQKNAADEMVKDLGIDEVDVVTVVKNDQHKASHILGDASIISANKRAIVKINAEAHRFAIAYHKKVRGKSFLDK